MAAEEPAKLHVAGPAPARCFDAYVMADWSSSSRPVTGRDSIWIAAGAWRDDGLRAECAENPATRVAAVRRIEALAGGWRDAGLRVLVGLDFAFGYPAGFARALGLARDVPPWRAVHAHVAAGVADDAANRHNRDAFAAACNARIAPVEAPGPFWGCHAGGVGPVLTQRRRGVFDYPYGALAEWRVTEQRARRRATTQPVWKLNCGVSVGGQTLLGIKHLHGMAERWGARRWPFDTGWSVPEGPAIWFAEIFPSLVSYPEWADAYAARRDRTQVLACVRHAAEQDAAGTLAAAFAAPPDLAPAERARVEREEGWILGVR